MRLPAWAAGVARITHLFAALQQVKCLQEHLAALASTLVRHDALTLDSLHMQAVTSG